MFRFLILFFLLCLVNQPTAAQVEVEFSLRDVPQNTGKHVGIRGSHAPLSWYASIPLTQNEDTYTTTLTFEAFPSEIEFKFVIYDDDENPNWESIENRSLKMTEAKMISDNQWNIDQFIDISTLGFLDPKSLMADYALVERAVLEVHPGTYRYRSREEIDAALLALKITFQKPLTYGQAYMALTKMMATIQCDHTKVGIYNQQKTINAIIHRQKNKLPFTFKWVNDRMIVTHDATNKKVLSAGDEIVRINQKSAQEILQTLMTYTSADGATDLARKAKLEIEGFDFRLNEFDVYYPLIFPGQDDFMGIEVRAFGAEETKELVIESLSLDERTKRLHTRYPDFPKTRDDLLTFRITEDNIGILSLNSFGAFGWKKIAKDYKQFFADAFKQLKNANVEHLVIDTRLNNGGADEMKIELATYFDINEAPPLPRDMRSRYKVFPESLKTHIKTWGETPWYFNMKPDRVDQESGYFIYDEQKPPKIKMKKNVFKGQMYLLTSPANASLAFYLANDFKRLKLGTILGRETGGNMRDINGGQILFLTLPNSGIEIDMPVVGGFANGFDTNEILNQGVVPDIGVNPSIKDIYNHIDTEMTAVLQLIRTM